MHSKIKFLGAMVLIVAFMLACTDGISLVAGSTFKTQAAIAPYAAGQVQVRFGADGRVTWSTDNGVSFGDPDNYTVNASSRTLTMTDLNSFFVTTYNISADGNTLTPTFDSNLLAGTYGTFIKA